MRNHNKFSPRYRSIFRHLWWWTCLLCMTISLPVLAQTGKASGTVTDEKGEPLPSVTVHDKKTNKMVVTDEKGRYTIDAGLNDSIRFSNAGFEAQTVLFAGQGIINIKLRDDVKMLDEVSIGIRNSVRAM